jgi:hypothetical protein
MKRSNFSLVLSLLVMFASGCTVGALGYRLYMIRTVSGAERNPEHYRQKYMQEMRTRLNLNEQQVNRLSEILDRTRARYREVREKYGPEMKAIGQEQTEQIRSILNDEQRVEYEKIRVEREKRSKEPRGGSRF